MDQNSLSPHQDLPTVGSGLIRLGVLAKYIPAGRNGKKRHISTLYRYANRGVNGIRLESWRLPDGLYSSLEAWVRFVEQLTFASQTNPKVQASSPTKLGRHQQSLETEIEAVRASLGRKSVAPKKGNARSSNPERTMSVAN